MALTKREAKAVLAARKRIILEVNKCQTKLSPENRAYADSYWAEHIKSTANGSCYGSMPIDTAMKTLGLEDL